MVRAAPDAYFTFFSGCTDGPPSPTTTTERSRTTSGGAEQIGFAFSKDGLNFTRHAHNPIGQVRDKRILYNRLKLMWMIDKRH